MRAARPSAHPPGGNLPPRPGAPRVPSSGGGALPRRLSTRMRVRARCSAARQAARASFPITRADAETGHVMSDGNNGYDALPAWYAWLLPVVAPGEWANSCGGS